jgi:hypothetical protein
MKLTRNDANENGIFGTLSNDDGTNKIATLEHAYLQPDGSYAPKTPPGTYTCQKGLHTLEHHPVPFQAFEITNVPNHDHILIHIGNYNKDSEGCVLIGNMRMGNMIMNSSRTFEIFMEEMKDTDSFQLTIS